MASMIDFTALPDCFGRPTCDPAPVCPACGGLECLCRPRFFAGQLLTEDDLNRLDHYIQAKNRLHNRYLHGWGVACGLEVVCGVCEPDQRHVVVKPGYALSPCGNDIIVCGKTSIDVCDLISRCRPQTDDCGDQIGTPVAATPGGAPGNDDADPTLGDCGGGTEEWVLAVCYSEKPSRGVSALRATPADCACGCGTSGTKCGCGGHGSGSSGGCGCGSGCSSRPAGGSGCGCGCGGSGSRRKPAATPRTIPEQCEPTVVCETAQFVMYKPAKKDKQQKEWGAAARRFLCCLAPLLRELGSADDTKTASESQNWALTVYDAVRDFITTEGLYDCNLVKKLSAIAIPAPANEPLDTYRGKLNQSVGAVVAIGGIALQKCLCSALLPPCPQPSQSDCVPLATITVSRSACCVLNICNFSGRKFLVTIPNIQYWLSFIDVFSGSLSKTVTSVQQSIERYCCRPTREYQESVRDAQFFKPAAQPLDMRAAAGRAGVTEPAAASVLWNALSEPDRRVGVEHLLLGALGATDSQGKPFVTDEEMVNPSNFFVLSQIVAPLLRAVVPQTVDAVPLWSALAGVQAKDPRVDDLSRELDALKTTVRQQKKTIASLKKNK